MRLKQYRTVPPNGLIVFSGLCSDEHKKEEDLIIIFEPPKTVKRNSYLCDNKFHIEVLEDQLQNNDEYGVVVVDGESAYLYRVGNVKTLIKKVEVSLPNKQGRGGQSQKRFERIRVEKRLWYIKNIAELCTQYFINSETQMVTVKGIILAGCGDFKTVLSELSSLDARIKAKILNIVTIASGGESGLNEAMSLSKDHLVGLKLTEEIDLLNRFFEALRIQSSLMTYVYGLQDILFAIQEQLIDTLIISEDFKEERITYQRGEKVAITYKMSDLSSKDEVIERKLLIDEWKEAGLNVKMVKNATSEGKLFNDGYGGIAGFLRYSIDPLMFPSNQSDNIEITEDDDELFWGAM